MPKNQESQKRTAATKTVSFHLEAADDHWHPLQVRPGVWQGRRIFQQDGQVFLDLDISDGTTHRKGTAPRFKSEVECQVRCDLLNAPRLELLHSDYEDDEGEE